MSWADDLSRRRVLGLMAGGALAGAGATSLVGCSGSGSDDATPAAAPEPTAVRSTVPPDERMLVVLELAGGNDGLSTLVPTSDGTYHDARPTLAIDESELIAVRDGYGLHRSLAALHAAGLTVLDGVGARRPTLSHFDMIGRWWAGTPDEPSTGGPGFLGRVCDQLGGRTHLTGMSVGRIPSPALDSAHPTTAGLPDGQPLGGTGPGEQAALSLLEQALRAMGEADGTPRSSGGERLGRSLGAMLDLDAMLGELEPPSPGYPADGAGSAFGARLSFASQLLRSDNGIRVVYVSTGGAPFDTHTDHAAGHAAAWAGVLPGLESFRADLAKAGMTDRVLIATTSEFGRRLGEHAGGLDHGTASCALLMGPTTAGVVGDHPSLRRLDADGNVRATVSFDRYLATLAAWLDVDPASVLGRQVEPIPHLIGA